MALISSQARLFGIDLSTVWGDLKGACRDIGHWPVLRWLTPTLPVVLRRAQGEYSLWQGDRMVRSGTGVDASSAKFMAVELPEDIVLRRTLTMPTLSRPQVAAAVDLELGSASPFAADDLVSGHRSERVGPQRLQVEVVFASRRQLGATLATLPLAQNSPQPEVWTLSSAGSPIVLHGFGEHRRAGRAAVWRRIGMALLLLAVVLAAALAVTPTVQLRLRAIEAIHTFDAVRERTAKLTREREALVQSTDRIRSLADVIGSQTRPAQVLDQLTRMLPDDTFLQSLKIEGHKITLVGQATDAAALMQQLGNQAGVHDVRAPAAATRLPGAAKETFQIEFTLDAERAAAAAPAASAASAPASAASPNTPSVSAPRATETAAPNSKTAP